MNLKGDKLTRILLGITAILVLVLVGLGSYVAGQGSRSEDKQAAVADGTVGYDFSVLNEILSILEKDYVKPENIDPQTLYEAAINGITGVLNDSGTFYLDPTTYQLDTTLTGGFDGIGATVALQNNEIVIVAPLKNTPAEAAGIQSGDVVTTVNGESTKGWSVQEAVIRIRGERGTKVTVGIRHPDGTSQDYTLTRDRVKVDSVYTRAPGSDLQDSAGAVVSDIGYIQITEFSPTTNTELDAALKAVMSKGAKGIIIDVRRNGGGLLNSTILSADLLLDNGTILTQRDSDGKETTYQARKGETVPGVPIVVLIDRFSASASEVLAAALSDNGRATTIGEKSFGKGTVNSPHELADGGALFVTIAQWLTPKGRQIDKVGITPDIEVIPTDKDIDLRRDVVLFRAIDVLRGQAKSP